MCLQMLGIEAVVSVGSITNSAVTGIPASIV